MIYRPGLNSLWLEPEISRPAPAASVANSPLGRGPGVAAVRAIRPQSGLLACIESIARDRKMSASQQALLQRFPRRCRRFQADEGRVDYRDALELMAELVPHANRSNSWLVGGREPIARGPLGKASSCVSPLSVASSERTF